MRSVPHPECTRPGFTALAGAAAAMLIMAWSLPASSQPAAAWNGNGNGKHQAEFRLLRLRIGGSPARTVALFPHEVDGRPDELLSPLELPTGAFDDTALGRLPRKSTEGCQDCIALSSLGQLIATQEPDVAELRLHPELMRSVIIGSNTRDLPILRAELDQRPGAFLNYRLRAVDERREQEDLSWTDTQTGFAELELGLSLGPVGSLRASGFASTEGENRRGDITLDRYFRSSMSRLTLGETFAQPGQFGSASRIAGLQYSREFGTQPGFITTPGFEFSGATQLPAVVDLYVDGQRQFQQSVGSGQFELRDIETGSFFGPEVEIIVRDAAGDEQVIRTRLFGSPALLRPGLSDFSLEAGMLRTADDGYEGWSVSGTYRRGLLRWLTLEGHLQWAQDAVDEAERFGLASLAASFSSPVGNFLIGAGAVERAGSRQQADANEAGDQKETGYNARLTYDIGWRGLAWSVVLSADASYSDEYRVLGAMQPRSNLYRGSASFNWRRFSVSGSALSDGEDLRGYTASTGFALGWSFFVSASATKFEGREPVFGAKLSWSPRVQATAQARHLETVESSLSAVELSGRLMDRSLLYQGNIQQRRDLLTDERNEFGEARLFYTPRPLSFDYIGRFSDTLTRNSLGMSGALAQDGWRLYSVPWLDKFSGYGVIDTGVPGIRLQSRIDERVTDGNGRAVFAVPAFRDQEVLVDEDTLPAEQRGAFGSAVMAVYPGQKAALSLARNLRGFLLQLDEDPPRGEFTFNGRSYAYIPGVGAYITNANSNINRLQINGHSYAVRVPALPDGIPMLRLDAEDGTLKLVDALGDN